MSNKKNLIILIIVALLAGGGRYWAKSYHETWDYALANHKNRYKDAVGLAREVQARRELAVYGFGDSSYQSQIQEFAGKSRLGDKLTVRPRGDSDVGDYTLNVDVADQEARYSRQQIFAFLYNCEVKIPRIRTTQLSIRPVGEGSRKLKTGAEREDVWKIESLTFTKRSPERQGS